MKNCNNCVKQDVCTHCDNIIGNFQYVLEPVFGSTSGSRIIVELKNLIAKHCKYFLDKGEDKCN